MFLILLLSLAFPLAQSGVKDGVLPPFDPGRAYYNDRTGLWCDPNWCLFDPKRYPQLYQGPNGCQGPCGMPRLEDAEDPDVRDWNLIQSLAGRGELRYWIPDQGFFRDTVMMMFGPEIAGGRPPWDIPEKVGGPGGNGGGNPGGGNPGHPGTPGGSADACPAPEAIRFDPVWTVRAWPPHPLVVGQDPRREGIRYEIEVRIPPVLYRRYEKEPDVCVPVPDANGDGKPDREGSCSTTIGDPPVRWPGDLQPGACRLVEERYPEPIAGEGALRMTLRSSSREWILGELAARYPGAAVRMPEILLQVAGQGEILGDKTFVLRAVANPKPVDPGYYDVLLAFDTAGTPVSAPRRILWQTPADRPQPVYLLEVTIVK